MNETMPVVETVSSSVSDVREAPLKSLIVDRNEYRTVLSRAIGADTGAAVPVAMFNSSI